nr:phenylalanine--tRNA ligase subunit alpha [Paracoccaceae bacterium]
MDELEKLRIKYLDLINKDNDQNSLENLRVEILGKKGELSLKMRELGSMTPEERQSTGPVLNSLRDEVTKAFVEKKSKLEDLVLNERLKEEWIDLSLPARKKPNGSIHPISQV